MLLVIPIGMLSNCSVLSVFCGESWQLMGHIGLAQWTFLIAYFMQVLCPHLGGRGVDSLLKKM